MSRCPRSRHTLTKREEKRLRQRLPSVAKTKHVFAPIEQILRDLKAKSYERTERGTPVVLNRDGTAVPTMVAVDGWFDFWKALAAQYQPSISFDCVDLLVLSLRRGPSYVKPNMIEDIRSLLVELKKLYASLPLDVTDNLVTDVKLASYLQFDRETIFDKWPELRKEVS